MKVFENGKYREPTIEEAEQMAESEMRMKEYLEKNECSLDDRVNILENKVCAMETDYADKTQALNILGVIT